MFGERSQPSRDFRTIGVATCQLRLTSTWASAWASSVSWLASPPGSSVPAPTHLRPRAGAQRAAELEIHANQALDRRDRSTAAGGALLWPVATALAHANLERADPAPGSQLDQSPHTLQLFFSETVDGSFSRVQLLNARGDAVDRGDSHVAPDDPRSLVLSLPDQLPDGVYTVGWRTAEVSDLW